MSQKRRVVFLGRRTPALRAARELGLEVVRVDGVGRAGGSDGVVARLPWPAAPAEPGAWDALARALPEPERIAAVIGLVEAAVVPAARLRAALGLAGLDIATAERCADKLRMKQAVRDAGVRCAPFQALTAETRPGELVAQLGLPLVLKPRAGSGTRGQILVRTRDDLPQPWPSGYLAEGFVSGAEMSCEALLARGRLLFESATEYLVVGEANVVPAPLSARAAGPVAALQRTALDALGVDHGMTHLELFLGPEGPVFGELAARPPGGRIMRLIELAWGFDPWQAWLRVHLGEAPELPTRPRQAAGAWVLHPGAGRVRAVRGREQVAALPGVVRAHVRVAPGDRVAVRRGTGEEVGHLIVVGRNRDEAAARLRAAHAALEIEMARDPNGTA